MIANEVGISHQKKNYIEITCKRCNTLLTNIKPSSDTLPSGLIIKSFYLRNLKFSSSIKIAKDQSYGFHKTKCFNCKNKLGHLIIMGNLKTKDMISSVRFNMKKINVTQTTTNEDKVNSKFELNLLLINSRDKFDTILLKDFYSKFNTMKKRIDILAQTFNGYVLTMKIVFQKLIEVKKILTEYYEEIVTKKNVEAMKRFEKIISEKTNEEDNKAPINKNIMDIEKGKGQEENNGSVNCKRKNEPNIDIGQKKKKRHKSKEKKEVLI